MLEQHLRFLSMPRSIFKDKGIKYYILLKSHTE